MIAPSASAVAVPAATRKWRDRVPRACLLLLGIGLWSLPGSGAEAGQPANVKNGNWAILIAGISGDQELQREFIDEVKALRAILSDTMGYPADHIEILVDDPSIVPDLNARKSTTENLSELCRRIGLRATRDDFVFVFIAGHGNYDGKTYKLNLVGPDPTADQLAAYLYSIPARASAVINTTTCSGGSIGPLAQPGKIVVSATRTGQEKNRTRFGSYFVEALENRNADMDRNGRISVAEAFDYASRKVEAYYADEGLLQTEHPVLNDSSDGLLARTAYLDAGRSPAEEPALSAEERRLKEESAELERQIESLKTAKTGMPEEEYDRKLEALLLRLAVISAKLRREQSPEPDF